jgi:hypothetical protein
MLTELYISALLVDEEMADQVWEAWDQREIDDLQQLESGDLYLGGARAALKDL